MKKAIKQTTEFFATTLVEAENTVLEMKEEFSSAIVNHSIARKVKSTKEYEIEYFIVKVTVQHQTIAEVLGELV